MLLRIVALARRRLVVAVIATGVLGGLIGVAYLWTLRGVTRLLGPDHWSAWAHVPVLVGVGVSDAPQARQATRVADGVVQGASVVRRLMEGGADAVGDYVAEVRAAIDAT